MSEELKIISRQEAKDLGLKRFFTGKQCNNGHFSVRDTKSGRCMECSREWARRYVARGKAKIRREWRREWRAEYAKNDI